jgi:hypothetical protein
MMLARADGCQKEGLLTQFWKAGAALKGLLGNSSTLQLTIIWLGFEA